jgi:hypothetical protein
MVFNPDSSPLLYNNETSMNENDYKLALFDNLISQQSFLNEQESKLLRRVLAEQIN